jgi:hypothetical protein
MGQGYGMKSQLSAEFQAEFGPSDWVSDVFVRLDDGVAYVSARGE